MPEKKKGPGRPKKMATKKAPAKKTAAKKSPAKKEATKKKPEEKKINEPLDPKSLVEPDPEDKDFNDLINLTEEDDAFLKAVKTAVDEKMKVLISDSKNLLGGILLKTKEISVDGQLIVDLETGMPKEDWSKITEADIKLVLMKIPMIQFTMTSLEWDSWAAAEMAKIAEKRSKADEDVYRKIALQYAHKKVQAFNEALERICTRWSRAVELVKEENRASAGGPRGGLIT